jgi:putative drug exporter of the RND superfamily
MARLGDLAYRRRGAVVACWTVATIALLAAATRLGGEGHPDYAMPVSGSSSLTARAVEVADGKYSPQQIQVVWRDPAGAESPAARRTMRAFFRRAEGVGDVGRAFGIRISSDGETATATVPLTTPGWEMPIEEARRLVKAAEDLGSGPVDIGVGGEPIERTEETRPSEALALVAVAIVLLVTFGSAFAVGLSLMVAGIGLLVVGALVALLTNVLAVPAWAAGASSSVSLAVGAGYVLLVLFGFGTFLREGRGIGDAVVASVDTVGRIVLFGGGLTITGLMCLFLFDLPFLYGSAASLAAAIVVAVLGSLTLFPAFLSYAGWRVAAWRIGFLGPRSEAFPGGWGWRAERWSEAIGRRPRRTVLIAVAILLVLATPALGMRLGFPDAGNDPPGTMARKAYDLISEGFGPGANGPLVVAVELPAGRSVEDLAGRLRRQGDVSFVSTPGYDAADDEAILDVTPTSSPQDPATAALIGRLRKKILPDALRGMAASAEVGGTTAVLADQTVALEGDLGPVLAVVAGLFFLFILAALRSLAVPFQLVLFDLLGLLAAYGVTALAARGELLGRLVGIDHPIPVPPDVAVAMVPLVFGLATATDLLFVSRVHEFHLRSGDPGRSVAAGLVWTMVPTLAVGALGAAALLPLVVSSDISLKLLGLGLGSAALLDAVVVKMALLPATMHLLGERSWWLPAWLGRTLPRLDVEPGTKQTADGRGRG